MGQAQIKDGTVFHLGSKGIQALFISNTDHPNPWFTLQDHDKSIFSGTIVNAVYVNMVVTIIGKMQDGSGVVITIDYKAKHVDLRSKLVNVSMSYDSVTKV